MSSAPNLMLSCLNTCMALTMCVKAGPLFPARWKVLRTLLGLLSEMFIRKPPDVNRLYYVLLISALPARRAPLTCPLLVHPCRNLTVWWQKLMFSSSGLLLR